MLPRVTLLSKTVEQSAHMPDVMLLDAPACGINWGDLPCSSFNSCRMCTAFTVELMQPVGIIGCGGACGGAAPKGAAAHRSLDSCRIHGGSGVGWQPWRGAHARCWLWPCQRTHLPPHPCHRCTERALLMLPTTQQEKAQRGQEQEDNVNTRSRKTRIMQRS